MIDPDDFGDMPTFIVHKSYQRSQRLDEVFSALADARQSVRFGIAINLPRQDVAAARRFLDRFSDLPLRLADPEVFSHKEQLGGATGKSKSYAYLKGVLPQKPDRDWVEEVIDAQRAVGATALLSATGWVDDSQAQQSLARTVAWVAESRRVAGDDPMFVNLCLPRRWLTEPELRTRLLNEVVESSERLWYIRVRWGVMSPRYGQLRDQALLEGYRELVGVMSSEDRNLILPNTGLTGWLATAWGAAGFSTGTSASEQAFADQPQIRMRRGAQRVRRPRYFERGFLHTVDVTTHAALLAEKNYAGCDCEFCDELDADDPDVDPTTWNPEAASLHYLLQAGRLTRLLATRNARAAALKEVRRASKDYEDVAASLAGENVPQHLRIWDQILR